MKSQRIFAIATKEWRLNLRFATEYFVGNLIGPIKSAILMIFLYSGFFRASHSSIGGFSKDNYLVYVILGTTCHNLFTSCVLLFRSRMVMEKWWQTVVSTLVSPASIFDVIFGFILGSGGIHIAMSLFCLICVTIFSPVSISSFFLALIVIVLLAVFGFGIGLVGALIGLSFEGESFLFDYSVQALTFLSCFYYPVDILPHALQQVCRFIPTFQLVHLLQQIYVDGNIPHLALSLGGTIAICFATVTSAALLFDYAIRRFGIIGY